MPCTRLVLPSSFVGVIEQERELSRAAATAGRRAGCGNRLEDPSSGVDGDTALPDGHDRRVRGYETPSRPMRSAVPIDIAPASGIDGR